MELEPHEIGIQGTAMVRHLHQMIIELTARLADAEGTKAVLEARLQATLAKIPKVEGDG